MVADDIDRAHRVGRNKKSMIVKFFSKRAPNIKDQDPSHDMP